MTQPKNLKKCQSEPSFFTISPEEIYDLEKKTMLGGIEGYAIAPNYFDYRYQLWDKRRKQIKAEHKPIWPPTDWATDKKTQKKVPPQKTNFIDEQVKWAKSFIDEEKAKKIKEDLEAKGRGIPENYSNPVKNKSGVNLREKFLKEEQDNIERRKKVDVIPAWKENAIQQVQSKIEDMEKNKQQPKHYKPNFSMCDRVTIVADAEYVGEAIPFYKSPPPKDGDDPKKIKLFFPDKNPIWHKNPSWSFNLRSNIGKEKQKQVNEHIKARDELLKEKAEKALEKSNIDLKKYCEDYLASYEKVNNRGRLPFLMHKPFEYQKVPQYVEARGKKRDYTPAPNHYWDDGKAVFKRVSPDGKQYLGNRDKTFKRVNIPYLRRSVF